MTSERQLAHMEKMRASRAGKQAVSNQEPQLNPPSYYLPDDKVWFEGFLVALRNREVKSASDVVHAIPVADEILKTYKAKFKGQI